MNDKQTIFWQIEVGKQVNKLDDVKTDADCQRTKNKETKNTGNLMSRKRRRKTHLQKQSSVTCNLILS